MSPFFIPMMLSNMPAAYVAINHGAKGPNMAVVTACASATHSMGEAYNAIVRDDADIILTGGADGHHPHRRGGLRVPQGPLHPERRPRPGLPSFDRDRDGFVMGEGAGVLVFEEQEHALRRGAPILASPPSYESHLRRLPHHRPGSGRGRSQAGHGHLAIRKSAGSWRTWSSSTLTAPPLP